MLHYIIQRCHNDRDGVSNHQPHDCLLKRLFKRRSKETSKLRVTGFWAGNSPETGAFPAQKASNAEKVSIWWRHHVTPYANCAAMNLSLHVHPAFCIINAFTLHILCYSISLDNIQPPDLILLRLLRLQMLFTSKRKCVMLPCFIKLVCASLLRNSGNKHQTYPLVSAEIVHHSSTYSIIYVEEAVDINVVIYTLRKINYLLAWRSCYDA